jgi:hypothetical protein
MSDHRVVHTFSHGGKDYEVRLQWSPSGFVIRAWTDNRIANGYAYHADYETTHDFSRVLGLSIVKEFAKCAADDVTTGRWEELTRVLAEAKE